MRLLAFLLLAAVLGFLVGRLTAPEGRGRGGGRGPPQVVIEPAEPAAPPADAEPPAASRVDAIVRANEPLDTRGDVGESEEYGVVAVDFEGFDGDREAWLGCRTIRGGYDEYDLMPEEGETAAELDMMPGIYDVWWQGREGRRGTRAAVEAGKRTVLRAAEILATPPVPEGLGILDLEVEATWGGGLSCAVTVKGKGETDEIVTNTSGRGSAVLFPGRYVLCIGDRREEVRVVEGRATSHRIACGAEGSILLDTGNEIVDSLGLAGTGSGLDNHRTWTGFVDGVYRSGFVFVLEGEYDVCYVAKHSDTTGVPLGRASVNAGRTTWLRCRLPQGGLSLRVTVPEYTPSQVGIVVRPIAQTGEMMQWEPVVGRRASFTAILGPGRYSVTASAGGCEPQRVDFDVDDRMVELAVELVRAR